MSTFNDLLLFTQKVKLTADEEETIVKTLSPLVQKSILDTIKPNEKDLLKWKYSEDGKKEFAKYMVSRLNVVMTRNSIDSIWNYYQNNRVLTRNSSLVKKFKKYNKDTICAHCGISDAIFHVDHVIPLSKGGLDNVNNLQYLCQSCNIEKADGFDCNETII